MGHIQRYASRVNLLGNDKMVFIPVRHARFMKVHTPGVMLVSRDEEEEFLSVAISQFHRFEQESNIQLRDEFANALYARMLIWKHDSRRNELLNAGLESGVLCVAPNPEKVDSLGGVGDQDIQIQIHPLFEGQYSGIVDYIIKSATEKYGEDCVQIEFGN